MESRPELTADLDSSTFREYYYLKEELTHGHAKPRQDNLDEKKAGWMGSNRFLCVYNSIFRKQNYH